MSWETDYSTTLPALDGDTRADVVISETEWLLVSGEDGTRIATRLGYSDPRNLARMLLRWGRDDLARAVTPPKERTR